MSSLRRALLLCIPVSTKKYSQKYVWRHDDAIHTRHCLCKCPYNLFHSTFVFDGSSWCFRFASHSIAHSLTQLNVLENRLSILSLMAESALSFFRLKAHCVRLFVHLTNKRRINKKYKPNRLHPHCCRSFLSLLLMFFLSVYLFSHFTIY